MARQIRLVGDFDHFLDRFDQLVAFVADMAGIDAAVLRDSRDIATSSSVSA